MKLPAPFGWSCASDADPVRLTVEGTVPPWLRGTLMRNGPAVFEVGNWKATHWFDGLALLSSFRLGDEVSFRQRLIDTEFRREVARGELRQASFHGDTKRSLFSRIVHPAPAATDNTNVNVFPWNGEWLALTETKVQYRIDGDTLETRGAFHYDDALGDPGMTAHPVPMPGAFVNLATAFARRSKLHVVRVDAGQRSRALEGTLSLDQIPYVHAFGASQRFVTVLDHPLSAKATRFLLSNRGYVHHFRWEPERGGRLWLVDRRSGAARAYATPPFFCLHTIGQFEDGDDVVLDFLDWKTPTILEQLAFPSIEGGHPPVTAKWTRARLRPGRSAADFELVEPTPFEFPVTNWTQRGQPTDLVWGATLTGGDGPPAVVKLQPGRPVVRFVAEGWVHGEPLMVPRPNATAADDGVLLALGVHLEQPRSALFVLDASTLRELARAEVDVQLPLGFHGSFRSD